MASKKPAKPKSKAKPKPAPAPDPARVVALVGDLLRLGQSMLDRRPGARAWAGAIELPAGGVATWRARKVHGTADRVGDVLDRLADCVARGDRWLDLHVRGDTVEVQGWDWLDDDLLDRSLAAVLDAAAPLGAKGTVATYSRRRDGSAACTTRRLAGKKLVIDEGETAWDAPVVRNALAVVAPRFDAWLVANPSTRDRIEHAGCWGFVDRDGREVIPPRHGAAHEFSDGLAAVGGRDWGARLIDVDGIFVTDRFELLDQFKRGRAPAAIGDSDHWGYIDGAGAVAIAPTLTKALPFHGPLAQVMTGRRTDGVSRWITPAGQLVGDPFEYTSGFAEDRTWIYSAASGFRCVDAHAQPVIARAFSHAHPFSEGLAAVLEVGATRWGYVDAAGAIVIEARFDEAHAFSEGRAIVRVGGSCRLIDRNGAFVGAPFDAFTNLRLQGNAYSSVLSEGMLAVRMKGKVGFLNADGELAIAPRFEDGFGFFEGRAHVATTSKQGTVWSHIDRDGELAIPGPFEWTGQFAGGRAPVKVGGRFGFIDETGAPVVPARYRQMQPGFTDGRAWVQLP